jgi:dTDP-4-dehydrorhamnose 3,5-epimerase
MKFFETTLNGAFKIELEKFEDERGFFARVWDYEKFYQMGLDNKILHCNISFTIKKGSIRGLHYQLEPYSETKLIRCTRGKIYDVIIDLRIDSSSYLQWFSIELSSSNYEMLYVPKGFAHGFQTLEPNTEVYYQNSQIHAPKYENGIKWNDPTFNIKWPLKPTSISKKDMNWKDCELKT